MGKRLYVDSSTVLLELSSRPESISLVRGMLAGVAEALQLELELLDDLKTAVTEACNNVVLHAYGPREGSLAVSVLVGEKGVEVGVRDWGAGLNQVAPAEERMHVGLALISALADRAEFLSAPTGGTEVRMAFTGADSDADGFDQQATATAEENWHTNLPGDVVVTLSPALLSAVLGRLARALAASARFTLDRFSDLYLVTDALAAHAVHTGQDGPISFGLVAGHKRLALTIGPFDAGTARQLRSEAASEGPPLLALLADELAIDQSNDREILHLVMQDHHPDPEE